MAAAASAAAAAAAGGAHAGALRGAVVLVTGASSGIGEACALQFGALGARLVLLARRRDRLEALAQRLLDAPAPAAGVHVAVADVSDAAQCAAAVAALPAEFADVDVLVNSAGLAMGVDVTEAVSDSVLQTVLGANVVGIFNMIREVLPGMKKRDRGHIINIGSIAGLEGYANGSAYCASKYAVAGLTRALRLELVPTALRVTHIAPGLVETEFSIVRFGGDKDRADRVYAGLTPLSADDIAETVVFAATRPAHVQVAEMIIFCTNQGGPTTVHRRT